MEPLTFALAQYVPDLLRQEPRNVGVLVADASRIVTRFLGEEEPGRLSRARIPAGLFHDVDLYAQWHAHWTRRARTGPEPGRAREYLAGFLVANRGAAFSVVYGGEHVAPADGALKAVARELFERLVQPAEEAAAAPGDERRATYLGRAMVAEFQRIGILERGAATSSLFVRHPVRWNVPVYGTNPLPHHPDFVQDNGVRWVIEQVDFSVRTAARARDHAMHSVYILRDLHEARGASALEIRPVVVANRAARRDAPFQDYALAALADVPGVSMVYWDRPEERARFLEERRAVAEGEGGEGA